MSRFTFVLAILLVLGAVMHANSKNAKVMLKIQNHAPDGTLLARPYVPPFFNLKPDKGNPSVKDGEVLACVQDIDGKKFQEHADTFVTYLCSDGKLKFTLNGVYFTE